MSRSGIDRPLPHQPNGLHSGGAGSVQFLDHIGQKQDLGGWSRDAFGNRAIGSGFPFVADRGIEVTGEQSGEIASFAMAE